jgi:hypothetical protein
MKIKFFPQLVDITKAKEIEVQAFSAEGSVI